MKTKEETIKIYLEGVDKIKNQAKLGMQNHKQVIEKTEEWKQS